jgi:hypothetical protein
MQSGGILLRGRLEKIRKVQSKNTSPTKRSEYMKLRKIDSITISEEMQTKILQKKQTLKTLGEEFKNNKNQE